MTSALSFLAPVSAAPRDAAAVTVLTGQRPVSAVAAVETARALRPVDPANTPEKLREPLVGPPPTFDVSVLQDIRARLADSARTPEPADTSPEAEAVAPEPAGPSLSQDLAGVEPEPPHHLDKKV